MNRQVVVGSDLASANLRLKLHAVLLAFLDSPRVRKVNPLFNSGLRALVLSPQDSDFLARALAFQLFFCRRLKDLLSAVVARVPNLGQEIAILIAVENQFSQALGSAAVHPGGQYERSLLGGIGNANCLLAQSTYHVVPGREGVIGHYEWERNVCF